MTVTEDTERDVVADRAGADRAVADTPVLVLEADPAQGVRWLTLDNPRRRNALSGAMIRALGAALDRAAVDPSVRVIVLGANGPAFSAGHDLGELRDAAASERTQAGKTGESGAPGCLLAFQECSRLMTAIVRLPKPVIACVSGLATAAGSQLAASCDLVVAGESAAFATPGVNLGLFCSTPAVALARSVGRKPAMEMLLTGEPVSAARAREIGLVNRVVPDAQLREATLELAGRIATRSPVALRLGKTSFYRQLEVSLEEAYALTSQIMADNLLDPDAAEGIDAFFEKREPRW
jgi:enoyl-CoA hydratase/carnithine racemase